MRTIERVVSTRINRNEETRLHFARPIWELNREPAIAFKLIAVDADPGSVGEQRAYIGRLRVAAEFHAQCGRRIRVADRLEKQLGQL